MNDFQITLGGKTYQVRELPIRPARALREKLSGMVEVPIQAIQSLPATQASDTEALAQIARALKQSVIGSIDLALDVVYEYVPEIKADRERVETEATDSEALEAFVIVIGKLFPFGRLTTLLGRSGLANLLTSKSSHSASGDSTPTN